MNLPEPSQLIERLHSRREKFKRRSVFYRAVFVAAGAAVTVAGIGMLALPGPAFVVIPLGLFMLALQFDWAERLLVRVINYVAHAKQNATGLGTSEKVIAAALVVLLIAAAGAVVYFFDVPLLPF